jgi:hypothetical protein
MVEAAGFQNWDLPFLKIERGRGVRNNSLFFCLSNFSSTGIFHQLQVRGLFCARSKNEWPVLHRV